MISKVSKWIAYFQLRIIMVKPETHQGFDSGTPSSGLMIKNEITLVYINSTATMSMFWSYFLMFINWINVRRYQHILTSQRSPEPLFSF